MRRYIVLGGCYGGNQNFSYSPNYKNGGGFGSDLDRWGFRVLL